LASVSSVEEIRDLCQCTRALHARSSAPTRQIRDVTAPTGLTTLLLQVMRRTRADPVCPSTQPTAGARSPCGATDDRAAGGVTSLPTRRAAAYLHCRHAAQRRIFTFHTPRSGVSSLSTRRAAACDLTPHTPRSGVRLHLPHPAQRHVPSLLTRRAAACVFTPHTPRSGVCLHFPHATAFICTCRAAEGRLGGVG